MSRNRGEKQNRFDREAQKHQRMKNVHPSKTNDAEESNYKLHGPIDVNEVFKSFEYEEYEEYGEY
jgi:hypothetical protein